MPDDTRTSHAPAGARRCLRGGAGLWSLLAIVAISYLALSGCGGAGSETPPHIADLGGVTRALADSPGARSVVLQPGRKPYVLGAAEEHEFEEGPTYSAADIAKVADGLGLIESRGVECTSRDKLRVCITNTQPLMLTFTRR